MIEIWGNIWNYFFTKSFLVISSHFSPQMSLTKYTAIRHANITKRSLAGGIKMQTHRQTTTAILCT